MEVLIGARVVQGIGGAAMLTLSLAIVSEAFGDEQRPRALGSGPASRRSRCRSDRSSAGCSSTGCVALGLLDGVLPLLAGWLITARATRETRDEQADPHVDVPGLAA